MAAKKIKICDGCLYRTWFEGEYACYYIILEDMPRPCKTHQNSCECFKPFTKKGRKLLEDLMLVRNQWKTLKKMRLADYEIEGQIKGNARE